MRLSEPIVEVEDEDFLSQVAAVVANALSVKRRKITAAVYPSNPKNNAENEAEGAYTAALRGSRSLLFQQQSTTKTTSATAVFGSLTNKRSNSRFKVVVADHSNNNAFPNAECVGGGGGVSCFKCGKSGHWARDCDASSYSVDPSVPEKTCPCGLGGCVVLTANTDKNRGRKFYKCPVREENGGCGFFEWCDNSSRTDNIPIRCQTYALNPSLPELPCPCGGGSCLILTAKTGKSVGQQFYRCPASQGSCGFFKWCNDHTLAAGLSDSVNTSNVHRNMNEMSNKSYGITSSSCFKCGKDGHWAKDCLMTSLHTPADFGGKCASSGTCYKCGKPGHWAKDCSFRADVRLKPRQ